MDMGERPSPDHTLDRIDGRKGYYPGNVHWATRLEEQSRNLSSNQLILFSGRIRCRAAWAGKYGLSPNTVGNRLTNGWSVKKALTTPARKPKTAKKPKRKQKRQSARIARSTS